MSFEERLADLQNRINASNRIVFFGGAGVSTESGIPDFRSKDGLYNQHDVRFDQYSPEYLLSHSCLRDHPEVFYEFSRQKLDGRGILPNVTHLKLAELEQAGKLLAVITQNIDGLHQKAGSKKVFEVHGTMLRNYCESCGKEYPEDYIFETSDPIPRCTCGGKVRPDVTLYEESLPEKAWRGAIEALSKADMLIVGGTSLTVYPASNLVREYTGENMVLINRDQTAYDHYADLIFHEGLGEVFSKIVVS
ncbi:MAG: NAD-dependent protein deacylase [Lachnospiraceae bacterium]|nr:NAD-dependent protein deacylase [Lachnospiraceae bacterium]